MIVTLDGQRLARDFASACTLQTVLDQTRAELRADHLVVSVAVNGQEYGERELAAELSRPLDRDAQVDLESGDRFAISADALRRIAAGLAQSGRLQRGVADRLSAGQAAEALAEIGELVQIWRQCWSGVVQCGRLVGRDLTREQFEGRAVGEYLRELIGRLRELRDALEARDMVLLADLIHYEMPALCQTWHDLLLDLAGRIAGVAPAGD